MPRLISGAKVLKDQHPFWTAWTRVIIQRPLLVIFCALTVTGILALQAWRTPKDLSFTGLLDEDDVEMLHFRETVDIFSADAMLVLLLEGERAEIDRSIALLISELPRRADIRSITPPADPQWLIDRAPWLWPRPLFDSVLRAVESGETPEHLVKTVSNTDQFLAKALRPVDEAALLGIGLERSPLDMAMGGRDFYRIQDATEAILEEGNCDVTHAFTGLAATAAQDQRSVMNRIKILTPITLIAVLLLLLGVEGRLSRVLLAGFALSFAVAISFGLTGLTLGRLSITVTFFGILLLGLGIDFGIHLLVSLRDARSQGKKPEDCIRFGIRHTATAITLGGVSTALAFGLVALAPEPGARDMGFAALYGLLAALILMLTFLPAAWLLLERRHRTLDAPPRFNLPGLHRTVTLALTYPRTVLLVALILSVAGLAGIPRYRLETDLSRIISRDVTSFAVNERLSELFGVSPITYVAPVESLEQAREWTPQLLRLDDIAAVASVADVILPDREERRRLVEQTISSLPGNSSRGPLLERLGTALDAGLITLDNIPHGLSRGLLGDRGELALRIVPKEIILDGRVLSEQIDRIHEIAPTATGMPIIIKLVVIGTRDYIPIMIPGILTVVTIVLIIAFQNIRDTILALLPVAIGTSLSFGVFLWLDLQMSLLTTIVVPVILGLGVDDGIHVVDRLRQYHIRNDATIHEAVEGVGRAIFLTTATTCVSFLTLLFTNHAGLEGIAWFMLLGIPLCFIASITALPAAAKLLAPQQAPPRLNSSSGR